jgi:hypothetical protein
MAESWRMSRRTRGATRRQSLLAALEEGIPYQTLLASILHKYAAGRLVEKDA